MEKILVFLITHEISSSCDVFFISLENCQFMESQSFNSILKAIGKNWHQGLNAEYSEKWQEFIIHDTT